MRKGPKSRPMRGAEADCLRRKKMRPGEVLNMDSENFVSTMRTPRDLPISPNPEFFYAFPPISIVLLRGSGGKTILRPEAVTTVLTILSHVLNYKATSAFFLSTSGRGFLLNTMIRCLLPPPLGFGEPNPRLTTDMGTASCYFRPTR